MKHAKACFISVIVQTVCQQSLWHAVFLFQVKNCAYFGRSLEALLCVIATIVLSARKRSGSDKSTRPERKSTPRYG
jgi:hypothetical protein